LTGIEYVRWGLARLFRHGGRSSGVSHCESSRGLDLSGVRGRGSRCGLEGHAESLWWRALILSLSLLACAPSRQAMTAGEVGCPPKELSVTDVSSSSGFSQSAETWIAECRGRRFICTEVMTSSLDLDWLFTDSVDSRDSDVSCHEELTEQPSELTLKARETPLSPQSTPPSGAAGFAFGSVRAEARERCESSHLSWRDGEGASSFCSGTAASVGFEATTQLTFCKDTLCGITLEHVPASTWATAFSELDASLTEKYGPATRRQVRVPTMCRTNEQFDRCAEEGALDFEVRWQWPRGERLRLLLGKSRAPDGIAALRLMYVKPPSASGVNSSAL
jgi:hypothetical protein